MKKFLSICLAGLMLSGFQVSTTLAQSTPFEIEKSQVVNYGYAIFAQKKKLDECQEKIKKNPKDDKAWNELGLIHYEMKHYKMALDAFEHALKLKPNNTEYKNNRDKALAKVRNGET